MRKFIRFLLLLVLLLSEVSSQTAYAKATPEPAKTTDKEKGKDDNDTSDTGSSTGGSANIQDGKPTTNVYEKNTSIPSSFNVDYYDCSVPYALTYKELGGYNTAGYNYKGWHSPVSEKESELSKYVGTALIRENSAGSSTLAKCAASSKVTGQWKTDSETKTEYVEKNGIKFYICAIPMYFYKNTRDKAPEKGFPCFDGSNGQMFDVIMTDGTVIHFIAGDHIGNDHTFHGTSGGQDGVIFKYAPWGNSQYDVYKNLAHGDGLQILELWSSDNNVTSGFGKKYGFTSYKGKNKIAYLRMYKTTWYSDKWQVNSGVPEGFDFKLDGVNIVEGATSSDSNNSGSTLSGSPGSLLGEDYFIAKEKESKEKDVELTGLDGLSFEERRNLERMKQEHKGSVLMDIISWLRAVIAFIGIIITVYCIFFYLLYWFDRVNTITDFSILKVISFGKVSTSMDDESSFQSDIEGTKEVNHSDVIKIALVGFTLGMFLLSGRIFVIGGSLVRLAKSILMGILF